MTNKMNNQTKEANQLKDELDSFTGDWVRYRHPHNHSVICTPGVKHLAERAEAHWVINSIAGWIGTEAFVEGKKKDPRVEDLHVWELNVNPNDRSAVLHARVDSDVEPFIVQSIPFTDLPLDVIEVWAGFDGEHWTLYLPREH